MISPKILTFKMSNGNVFNMDFGDSKILTVEMIETIYECKLINKIWITTIKITGMSTCLQLVKNVDML